MFNMLVKVEGDINWLVCLVTCRSRVACAEEVGCLIEREGPRVYSGEQLEASGSQHSH